MFIVGTIIDAYLQGVNPQDILIQGAQSEKWWLGYNNGLRSQPEFLQSVKAVFSNFDANNDGKLSHDEAASLAASIQTHMGINFDIKMFLDNFQDTDQNGDGEVTQSEFAVKAYNTARNKGMGIVSKIMKAYENEAAQLGST